MDAVAVDLPKSPPKQAYSQQPTRTKFGKSIDGEQQPLPKAKNKEDRHSDYSDDGEFKSQKSVTGAIQVQQQSAQYSDDEVEEEIVEEEIRDESDKFENSPHQNEDDEYEDVEVDVSYASKD